MPPPVFYRKWRPQTLGQVVGQEHVTRTLLNALAAQRVAHAYLFCGPRGTGKTSTARILAASVNCLNSGTGEPCTTCSMCEAIAQGRALDLVEIDAASNRGIDDIRDLREKVNFAPIEARYKVYVVDEVHMLTDPAFNALLKTLEEPPPHAIFVLATTEVHRVPVTILSRCQRFDFRRIPQRALVGYLARICQAEGIDQEEAALELIVRNAHGSARDAVNLLEQVEVAYGAKARVEGVQQLLGLTRDPRAVELVRAVAGQDLKNGMTVIQRVREDGVDLPQFGREAALYLRALLLLKAGVPEPEDIPPELTEELRDVANAAPLEHVVGAVRAFSQMDFHGEGVSSLPLELALLDAVMPESRRQYDTPPAHVPAGVTAAQPRPISTAQRAHPAKVPSPETTAREIPAVPAAAQHVAVPPSPTEDTALPQQEQPVTASPPPQPLPTEHPQDPSVPADLAHLRQLVKELRVPRMRFIESLLRNGCTVEKVEGEQVTLGFKRSWTIHKERMERPENLRLAEQALEELTGTRYRIRCVILASSDPAQSADPRGHLVRAALDAGARRLPDGQT